MRSIFGYALGKDGEEYIGFEFNTAPSRMILDDNALLISQAVAGEYQKTLDAAKTKVVTGGPVDVDKKSQPEPDTPITHGGEHGIDNPQPYTGGGGEGEVQGNNRFYTTAILKPDGDSVDIADIIDGVTLPFQNQEGTRITIKLDIEVDSSKPFDPATERAVRENCRQLSADKDMEIEPSFY